MQKEAGAIVFWGLKGTVGYWAHWAHWAEETSKQGDGGCRNVEEQGGWHHTGPSAPWLGSSMETNLSWGLGCGMGLKIKELALAA